MYDYFVMLFKFVILYKNLDIVVDMGDSERVVKLVKYEFFVYYLINKVKYFIGLIYLILLIFGIFFDD